MTIAENHAVTSRGPIADDFPWCGLHELFEAQVDRTPDAVAVLCGDQRLSYAELDRYANRLAWLLREHGIGPEVVVGVCADRGVEMVVGLLGVLKAGGAYLPLDPEYPGVRLRQLVADAGVGVLLSGEGVRERWSGLNAVVRLDLGALAELPASRVRSGVVPENLAYVIYTSGSTGRPKGVMVPHRGVVNRVWWAQQEFRLGAEDAVLQKTPVTFDVSVWELFWPLVVGARLVLAEPGGHRSPEYIADAVEQFGVTVMHFVPSMLEHFLAREIGRASYRERVLRDV